MRTRQELFCTECHKYVQFNLDLDGDGNYTIPCPNCKHEHYRKVIGGKVSETRWRSSGGFTVVVSANTTTISTFATYSTVTSAGATGDYFLYQSWMNRTNS